jgi:hypothetical protein
MEVMKDRFATKLDGAEVGTIVLGDAHDASVAGDSV